MRKLLLALLATCLSCQPAFATCGARGFGTTFGVGSTDEVNTGYTATPASTMTFAAWFYRNGAGGGSLGRIFDQNGATATALVSVNDNTSSLAGTMAMLYGQSSASAKWHWTTPSSNAWHHIAVTFNAGSSGNVPIVYIDGAAVSITTDQAFTGTGSAQTTGSYYIGNRADGTRNWDGKLSDFAYWNVILTASQVKSLAQGASPMLIRPAALKIFLPLCGSQANEPDWASRLTQTITGTAGKSGNPAQPYPLMRTGL
jgi:Concanavalin A-like lectin/glucanases superfamily